MGACVQKAAKAYWDFCPGEFHKVFDSPLSVYSDDLKNNPLLLGIRSTLFPTPNHYFPDPPGITLELWAHFSSDPLLRSIHASCEHLVKKPAAVTQ